MLLSLHPFKPHYVEYVHMQTSLFLKNIKRYSQLDSTNREAEKWVLESHPPEGSAVLADFQSHGRGMAGNSWESAPGQNLLVSFILYPEFLFAGDQFMINKVVSLAVKECVRNLTGRDDVMVKWPNDVYAGDAKIAGILSQNSIRGEHIQFTVVGIGLNVNQLEFSSFTPKAVSMKSIAGKDYDREVVLATLASRFEYFYGMLRQGLTADLHRSYLASLYKFNREARFSSSGYEFTGIIKGVSPFGFLIISIDGEPKEFDIKDVQFLPDKI